MTATRAVVIFLALVASFPSLAQPAAAEVVAHVDRDGARSVVNKLYGTKRWANVLRGVESGDAEWLLAARKLRGGTDAGSTSDLEIAVFTALGSNPSGVLALFDPRGETRPSSFSI